MRSSGVGCYLATNFHPVLDRLALPAGEVLFVDDNAANVEAAAALGIRAEQWHVARGVPELRDLVRTHGLAV